jgi:hypothetical protein
MAIWLIAAAGPDDLHRYFEIKGKYDDLKFSKQASDFESRKYKELEASEEKDELSLFAILKSHFQTAMVKDADSSKAYFTPGLLAGFVESFCVDGIHNTSNHDEVRFFVTDTILVHEWQRRSLLPVTDDLSILARDSLNDLICDDASHPFFSKVNLPLQSNYDDVYASVNGATQDDVPNQPSELVVLGRKKTTIYVFWAALTGDLKNFRENKALQKKWKEQATSLLDLASDKK